MKRDHFRIFVLLFFILIIVQLLALQVNAGRKPRNRRHKTKGQQNNQIKHHRQKKPHHQHSSKRKNTNTNTTTTTTTSRKWGKVLTSSNSKWLSAMKIINTYRKNLGMGELVSLFYFFDLINF